MPTLASFERTFTPRRPRSVLADFLRQGESFDFLLGSPVGLAPTFVRTGGPVSRQIADILRAVMKGEFGAARVAQVPLHLREGTPTMEELVKIMRQTSGSPLQPRRIVAGSSAPELGVFSEFARRARTLATPRAGGSQPAQIGGPSGLHRVLSQRLTREAKTVTSQEAEEVLSALAAALLGGP